MKKRFFFTVAKLMLIFIHFVFFGCQDTSIESDTQFTDTSTLMLSKAPSAASNPQNPYDVYGAVIDSLVGTYYTMYSPTTDVTLVAQRVMGLIKQDSLYQAVYAKSPTMTSYSRITAFLSQPNQSPSLALTGSSLRSDVKVTLSNFMTSFSELVLSSATDAIVYETVRGFESQVLNSTYYTSYEKQELLQAASVARYTAYRKRKKPKKNTDSDWTVLIVHIASSVDASVPDPADRLYQSIVIGLAANGV